MNQKSSVIQILKSVQRVLTSDTTARQIELLGSPETQMPAFREGAGFGKHSHSVYAPEEKHDDHRGEHEDEHVQGDPHVWFDP